MEMKVQIPFQDLLVVVKTLTPAQKAKLRQQLDEENVDKENKSSFIEILLNGPVYSEKQIQTIEKTRKSIAQWRTKS